MAMVGSRRLARLCRDGSSLLLQQYVVAQGKANFRRRAETKDATKTSKTAARKTFNGFGSACHSARGTTETTAGIKYTCSCARTFAGGPGAVSEFSRALQLGEHTAPGDRRG